MAEMGEWHTWPVAVATKEYDPGWDAGYRGEWAQYVVGPEIPSRWKAIVAVIWYRLTKRIWSAAFDHERYRHE